MSKIGTPQEILKSCDGIIHPKALQGIELFDAKRYWHAHEAFEEAWLEEQSPARHLYRGILQGGVVYLHAERKNYRGVVKVYHRCRRWLDPFPEHCLGIDVGQLREDLNALYDEVLRLGPDRLQELKASFYKPINWVTQPQD